VILILRSASRLPTQVSLFTPGLFPSAFLGSFPIATSWMESQRYEGLFCSMSTYLCLTCNPCPEFHQGTAGGRNGNIQ